MGRYIVILLVSYPILHFLFNLQMILEEMVKRNIRFCDGGAMVSRSLGDETCNARDNKNSFAQWIM